MGPERTSVDFGEERRRDVEVEVEAEAEAGGDGARKGKKKEQGDDACSATPRMIAPKLRVSSQERGDESRSLIPADRDEGARERWGGGIVTYHA